MSRTKEALIALYTAAKEENAALAAACCTEEEGATTAVFATGRATVDLCNRILTRGDLHIPITRYVEALEEVVKGFLDADGERGLEEAREKATALLSGGVHE